MPALGETRSCFVYDVATDVITHIHYPKRKLIWNHVNREPWSSTVDTDFPKTAADQLGNCFIQDYVLRIP